MFREGLRPPDPFPERPAIDTLKTQDGMTLRALSDLGPVLAVCLPAPGTAGWRRVLERVARRRAGLERDGLRIVLVHAAAEQQATRVFERFDLHYLARIEDPGGALARELGLESSRPGALRRLLGAAPAAASGVARIERGEVVELGAEP